MKVATRWRSAAAWLLAATLGLSGCVTGRGDAPDTGALVERAQRDAGLLRDWGGLSRYAADNAVLPPPSPDAPRVVFLGDSITDGWGRPAGAFFPGRPWLNRGISGQTTPQMLVRFRADVIDLAPRAVVILAGINDIAGNTGPATAQDIQRHLMSMAELARAHGIRVVLATLLPVTDAFAPQTVQRPPARIVALNDWIRRYCARTGCTLLDYHRATVDGHGALRRELTDDGLHPNARGYAVMQPLAEAAVADALAPAGRR